jgi:hypothetical protein
LDLWNCNYFLLYFLSTGGDNNGSRHDDALHRQSPDSTFWCFWSLPCWQSAAATAVSVSGRPCARAAVTAQQPRGCQRPAGRSAGDAAANPWLCPRSKVNRAAVTANVVPSSPILVSPIIEAIHSLQTPVLTRRTRRNIPEDVILHGHRRENLKCYTILQHVFCTKLDASQNSVYLAG